MKIKNLLYASILSICIVFFSGVNTNSANRLLVYGVDVINENHSDIAHLSVLGVELNDEDLFLELLNEWGSNTNSLIIRRDFDSITGNTTFNVNSNYDYYTGLIVDSNLDGHSLSRKILSSEVAENRLFSFLDSPIEIYPLTYNADFTKVNNLYLIKSYDKYILQLINSLEDNLPNAEFSYREMSSGGDFSFTITQNAFYTFMSIAILLWITNINYILRNTRKISIQKLEGGNDYKLWYQYCINDGIFIELFTLFSLGILGQLILPLSANNSHIFYRSILSHLVVWLLLHGVIVICLFFSIKIVNIVSSMKGKQMLGEFIKYLGFVRLVILIGVVITLIPTTKFLISFANIMKYEREKLKVFHDIYLISSVKGKYDNYFVDNVLFKDSNIDEYFIGKHQMFSMETVLIDFEEYKQYILVDKQYLVNEKLWKSEYEDIPILFYFNLEFKNEIANLKSIYNIEITKRIDKNLVNYSYFKNLNPYNLSDSIYDYRRTVAMIYPGVSDDPAMILNKFIIYDGDNYQNYIDTLLIEMGYYPYARIDGFEKLYLNYKTIYLKNNLGIVIISIILLIAYLLSTLTYYRAWLQANCKKIYFEMMEGHSKFMIFKKIICTDLLLLVIIDGAIILVFKTTAVFATIVVGILLISELVVKIVFINKLKPKRVKEFL